MSEFQGAAHKVRCVDCTRLSGKICSAKRTSVAPKKRRTCGSYNFKGEFENRTPAEAVYVPHMDSNTKKLMKRLMKLGVMPVSGESNPYSSPRLPFGTTATEPIINVGEIQEAPQSADAPDKQENHPIDIPSDNEDV